MKCFGIMGALFCALLFFSGCAGNDETPPDNHSPNEDFQIHGIVTDASEAGVADAALHIVYELEEAHIQHSGSSSGMVGLRGQYFSLDTLVAEMAYAELLPGDNAVLIRWGTLSETNNDHFRISRDSQTIANIPSVGNSTTLHDYSYLDQTARNGTTYTYALSTVDLDGMIEQVFSDTATPRFEYGVVTEYALYQNFPNPVEDTTAIAFDLVEDNFVSLKIFRMTGAEVATLVNGVFPSGRHTVDFAVAGLANGLYRYRITIGSVFDSEKILMKNTSDYESLRLDPGIVSTDNAGHFGFDARNGDTIALYGDDFRSLGTAILDRARVVALKSGYAPADTSVSLAGGAQHTLDFVLSALR